MRDPSSAAMASLSEEKDLNSFPLREISLHFPCSSRTSERKPSHLISKSQSDVRTDCGRGQALKAGNAE